MMYRFQGLLPPVAAAYQLMVPADAVAPRGYCSCAASLAGVVAVIVGQYLR